MKYTLKSVSSLAAALITFGSLAGGANGAITVIINGSPGSSLVNISVSGSGTWQDSKNDDDVGWGTNWSSDFIADTVQSGVGLNLGDGAALSSGQITLINNGSPLNVDSLNFDSDGTGGGDDFVFLFSPGINVVTGETYSISGSGTFDLSLMEAGASFDDLNPGIYTNNFGLTPITLNIIPEPTSVFLITLGTLPFLTRRLGSRLKRNVG